MPPSHYVRSSDWVETKCFRSKVAQSQTHSWPHLKSKHLFIHKQITQNIFLMIFFACYAFIYIFISLRQETVEQLLSNIFDKEKNESAIVSVIHILLTLFETRRPAYVVWLLPLLYSYCWDITCRAAQCYENIQSKHIECCHMQYDLQYIQKYFKGKKELVFIVLWFTRNLPCECWLIDSKPPQSHGNIE